MHDFYTAFYTALPNSPADAAFCEYAYGKILGQHGFTTLEQLQAMLRVLNLYPGQRVLDVGCGDGSIAEYITDQTGARVIGLDYIPHAARQAHARTVAHRVQLNFLVADAGALPLAPGAFDALLSLDTIYFTEDYIAMLAVWQELVRPGGQVAIFFSHGANPQTPQEIFPRETLPPDKTPLAEALAARHLVYSVYDFSRQDYELAQRKRKVLARLQRDYVREGHLFLYDNRLAEALGVIDAFESGAHSRYLYHVRV